MNMNGWDTVFVASIDAINASLARATAKLIQKFRFAQQGFSVSGSFGTWSIVEGGSGELLMLQIQISSGSMQMAADAPSINLSGLSAQLLVSLQLLPSKTTAGGQSLLFDFKAVGPANQGGTGVVSPHDIVGGTNLTLVQKAALGNAIASALVQHASDISFVFASLNPTQAGGVPWMQPTYSRYAYLAPAGTLASLAILSVTSNRDVTVLPLLVDPTILQGKGNAGLAISPALFLQNVLAPTLLASFKASGTLMVNVAGVLVNSGQLALPELSRSGEDYHPHIDSLTAAVSDNQVQVALNGSCDMHMGVSMTFNASSNLGVAIDAQGKALSFSNIGTPTFHNDVDIPWYDHLFDIISPAAEIILQVTVAAISSQLGGGISDITSAENFVQNASTMVTWAGGGGFQAQSGSLAGAFCMRGSLS